MADASAGYDRDVLKGVGRYSNFVTGWFFRSYNTTGADELCIDLIKSWRPTGIISLTNTWSRPLKLAKKRGIPVVQAKAMGMHPNGESIPSIYTDPGLIAKLVVDYFAGHRLTSIAYVGSTRAETFEQDSLLEQAAKASGFQYDSFHGDPRAEFDKGRRFQRWIAKLPRRTGLLASSDWYAWHAISTCIAVKLKVPDDLAFLGVGDDSPWCELAPVPLSSISLAAEKIGYRAASLLDQLMRGRPLANPITHIPPVAIVVRRSTEILAAEAPDIAAALRFIHDHAADGCTVKQMLREVAIDRRRFERWCQQHLGRSPLQEIQRHRFANVKRLLADTDERLEEISRMVGFASAAVLSRAFHRETGITVAKYRRQFRRAGAG